MENYDSNFDEDNKQSKLNSGGLINIRIDSLWKDCHKHSRSGMYSSWSADMDCIWSEFVGEYEENSPEQKKFDDINLKLLLVQNWGAINGFKKMTALDKQEMSRQYQLLRKKEEFLHRIQNKQGKGTAYNDGSEDDWD